MSDRTIRGVLGFLIVATAACDDAAEPQAAVPEEIAFLDHRLSAPPWGRLSVLSMRTGEVRVLAGSVLQFDWAPDGSKLAMAHRDTMFVLSTVDAGGGSPTELLRRRQRILDVGWSRGGGRIAFAMFRSDLAGDSLWVIDADGGEPKPLASLIPLTTYEVARFAWLPGDTAILYQGADTEYHRVDVRSGATTPVTSGGLRKGPPLLSPQGGALVFECTADGRPALCTMSADGSGLISFASDGYDVWHPSWSPDGRTIAFAYRRHPDVQGALYVGDRYGTEMFALTEAGRFADVRTPIWSPDGRRIAFVDNRGSGIGSAGAIRVAQADGSGERVLAQAARLPAWRPAGPR